MSFQWKYKKHWETLQWKNFMVRQWLELFEEIARLYMGVDIRELYKVPHIVL